MTSSRIDIDIPAAEQVNFTDDSLEVALSDGRTISVPLAWYPRLLHASREELVEWRLIGRGRGIRWDSLDEDISVESLITGRRSAESQSSLQKWAGKRDADKRSRRR